MALSKEATENAFEILKTLNGGFGGGTDYDPEKPRLGLILYGKETEDGGCESIRLLKKNLSIEEQHFFDSKKGSIPNSSINKPLEGDPSVIMLGWY